MRREPHSRNGRFWAKLIYNKALRSSIELYAELACLTSFFNKPPQQKMASCQYGQIAGSMCGSSVDNPANVKSVVLAKCTKAIQGHLRPYNVRDATLVSESRLLLAREGMCVVHLQNICKGSFYIYSLAGNI